MRKEEPIDAFLRHPLRFALCLLASVALLAASCATKTVPAPVTGGIPRLVVVFIADGLPQRQVIDYRDQLAPDGLERFFTRGAWFTEAHYAQANTQTAPGHATILTGAYPDRTGMIANEWLNPATGELEYCAGDASAAYIGHKTNRLDGTSPKNLRVESLGDVLKRRDSRSKVIAISSKDRGAILPAGKAGVAYIYQAQTGQFASTTYYMKEHPKWVSDFNARKLADPYFHAEWKPLLDEAAYSRSLPDDRKWYAKGGKLPKRIGEGQDAPGPLFYGQLVATPFSDDYTLSFARAAIAGEGLGRDDAPDILILSLSAHDLINHAYGAESRISHDHVLYLDRLLQEFFGDLDVTVGRDNYVAVLTADHGFMPAPEYSQSLGRDAGRVNATQLMARLDAGLAKRFGEGHWGLMSAQGVLLNKALIAEKKLDVAEVSEEVRKVLLAEPAVAAVYTRAEMESGQRAGAPLFDAMRKSWDRDRSPDLQLALKPYWMFSSSSNMTTHGSPYAYDTHVPILFYGPPWVTPGRIDTRVEVADIAPTLARILGVPAPAACVGRPLPIRAPGT